MRIKTSKLLFILFMSSCSMAATYCLKSNQSVEKAKRSVSQLLISGEDVIVNKRTNCLEVAIKEYRRTLIDKFMKMSFELRSSTSMSEVSRRMCKFKLRKVSKTKGKEDELSLGTKNSIRVSFDKSSIVSTSELIVMEGREGRLSFNQESLFFTCDIRGKVTEVSFSLEKKAMTSLASVVEITPGQWMNIGSIRNKLNNQRRDISLRDGVKKNKVDSKESYDYFLTVY